MKILKPVLGMLLAAVVAPAQQFVINTIAGNGNQGYIGDTGPALQGAFAFPTAIAFDSKGNYYVVDSLNYVIREVSGGNLSTIAGNDSDGYMGDNGVATQAELSDVHGIAVDSAGNIYLADTGNSRIREVLTNGNIVTFAGNGTFGYTGDGAAAINAEIERPGSIAFDTAGNLYVPDYAASVVRKIDSKGNITTFAGTGTYGYSGDGGPAAKATLAAPVAVTVDAAGNVYVSDPTSGNIREITTDGNIHTVATNVYASSLAVDTAGNLYYPNYLNNTIEKILPGGAQLVVAGNGIAGYTGDGGPANNAELNYPYGVALDSSGDIYVSDSNNSVIRELTPVASSVGIVNAASNLGGAITPGEIVALYGTNIGPATLTVNSPVNGVFGTQLAGTTVSFDGNPAPILYTSAGQVAAIVPYEEPLWINAQVAITYQGKTQTGTIPIKRSAPGVFTVNSSGTGQAAAVNQDGTLNGLSHPAQVGSFISLYGTGEGYPTPPGTDGQLAPNPAPVAINTVTATINGQPAIVTYAGGSPGSVEGLLQVNIQIPQLPAALLANGPVSVPIALQIFGAPSQIGTTIVVSN